MDLEPFDEKLLPDAFGFRNIGATCYFNSLIQSLLSCTSLTKIMLENRNVPEYKNNIVAVIYTQLLDKMLEGANCMEMSPMLWGSIIKYLQSKNSQSHFGRGQEDSHESFKMLLDCWENLDDVIRVFTHKDHVSIFCTACSQWNNSQHEDANNKNSSNEILRFYELAKGLRSEIPPELERLIKKEDREAGTIESYLTRQITYLDYGYRCQCVKVKDSPCKCVCSVEKKERYKNCKCTAEELKTGCKDRCNCKCYCDNAGLCKYKCNSRLPKLKIVSMRIIPEILFIMCPAKVIGKYYENFPEKLAFKTKVGKTEYKAVSQIIHSGGAGGGHYWAQSIRNANKPTWYELNDTSYSKLNSFTPSDGTYVVIYHSTKN